MLLEDSIGFVLLRAVLYFPRLWKWRRSWAGIQDGSNTVLTPVEQRAYPAAASTEKTEYGEWTVLHQPTCQVLQIYRMSYCTQTHTHTLVHLHTKHPWFIHFTTVDLIWPDKLFNVWRSAALMEKGLFRVCIHQSFGFSTCWSVFRCVVAAIAWSSLTAHSKHTWVWRSLLQQQREASLCSPNPPRRHFLSRSRRKRRDFPPSSVRRGLGRWLCRGRPGPRRLVFPPVAANPSSDVVLSQVRLLLASILDPWGGGARPHHLPRLS